MVCLPKIVRLEGTLPTGDAQIWGSCFKAGQTLQGQLKEQSPGDAPLLPGQEFFSHMAGALETDLF